MFLDAPVIDADARHVENPLVLYDHLDSHARGRVRVVADGGGQVFWEVDDAAPGGGRQTRRFGDGRSPFRRSAASLGAIFPRRRLAEMDRAAIDVQLLLPTFGLAFASLLDVELATALCRASNDSIAAECAAAPARLVPVGVVPAQDATAATDEMRRCAVDLGMPAIVLPPRVVVPHLSAPNAFPDVSGARSLADPAYAPLFETAEFLDVAIAVHAAAASGFAADPGERLVAEVLGPRHALQAVLARLIVSGVFERYPRLRFGLLGAGCGWLPDFVHALGSRWQRYPGPAGPSLLHSSGFAFEMLRQRRGRGLLAEGRALRALRARLAVPGAAAVPQAVAAVPEERNPEEYLARGQVFASFLADDPGPAQLRDAFGPVGERLACWSSAYGAWDGRVDGAVARTSSEPRLTADHVARLLTTNALRFYGDRLRRRVAAGFPGSRVVQPGAGPG
jgi:predicted TIM-barrel fold metal-dependent hydrolase